MYSPGPFSGTHQDFHLSGTHSDFTLLLVLARISTFPALSQILHFLGTHPDPSPVLARIPPFWYSPGSHLSGTCPDPTFPVLARISTFSALAQILPFPGTHSDPSHVLAGSHLSGTRPDPPFSDTCPDSTFPVLAWISTILRYSPGFHLSGTCPDFYFFGTRRDSTFSNTHMDSTFSGAFPDPSSELARISLSFPTSSLDSSSSPTSPPDFIVFSSLCPDHSSSQASHLVFFKSLNQSDSVPLAFSTI